MAKVTLNPLIGPDPKKYKNIAAASVVKLASTIVAVACLNPAFTDDTIFRPRLSSSRIRSKISTLASTAIPIVSTIPAIPGKVSVAPNVDKRR